MVHQSLNVIDKCFMSTCQKKKQNVKKNEKKKKKDKNRNKKKHKNKKNNYEATYRNTVANLLVPLLTDGSHSGYAVLSNQSTCEMYHCVGL
jgi:polyphosphate kinase